MFRQSEACRRFNRATWLLRMAMCILMILPFAGQIHENWRTQGVSIPRPTARQAVALPTELWVRSVKTGLSGRIRTCVIPDPKSGAIGQTRRLREKLVPGEGLEPSVCGS